MRAATATLTSVGIGAGFVVFIIHLLIPEARRRTGAWMAFAPLVITLAAVQILSAKADGTDR